jgi:hypothetical protein
MKFKQFLNRKEIIKCYCSQLETGPKLKTTRWPARAQRAPHARPRRGPGPGKPFPTWAVTRSGNREPSICIQRPCVESGRTRTCRRPRANPSAHSFSPLPLPRRSERATELVGRQATQRKERKRARGAALSPSPACVPTVGWTRHHRVASQRRLRRGFHAMRSSTSGAPREILSLTTCRLAVVWVLPARLTDPRPTVVCVVKQVSV